MPTPTNHAKGQPMYAPQLRMWVERVQCAWNHHNAWRQAKTARAFISQFESGPAEYEGDDVIKALIVRMGHPQAMAAVGYAMGWQECRKQYGTGAPCRDK